MYAEALLVTATKQNAVDEMGDELEAFVSGVLDKDPQVGAFLATPAIGKRVKLAILDKALPGRGSDLLRGLFATLARNGRLNLVRGIAVTYRSILDEREGRVRVKVTTAAGLSDAQRGVLTTTLSNMLKKTPVLDVRVEPDILGGMVVQVGDRVIDTSVRTRLQTLRTLLLDKGISYGKLTPAKSSASSASRSPSSTGRSRPARSGGCWKSATASPASTACPASWPARWSSSPQAGVRGLAFNLEENSVGVIILGDYLEIGEGDEVRTTGAAALACRSARR